MEQSKTCKTYKHFWQHYVKFKKTYHSAKCGHCTYARRLFSKEMAGKVRRHSRLD